MKKQRTRDGVISYCKAPHLHLIGSSKCVVDGLKNVIEYTRERIKVDLGKYCITLVGANLCINEFSPEGAVIEGDILNLEFSDAC